MVEEAAIIVYEEDGEVDEIVFAFGSVEQAKRSFENEFNDPEDFYKSPDNSVEQAMVLYVMVGKRSLDWTSPRVSVHSLEPKVNKDG